MNGKIVYLAGGMQNDWQETVIESCKGLGFVFKDPRQNRTKELNEYTVLDLHHVRNSDIIFCYIEKDNPSGYGACVECGYARGLGKTVIIVNEKQDDKYLRFIEETADIVFTDFSQAIEFLKKFQ